MEGRHFINYIVQMFGGRETLIKIFILSSLITQGRDCFICKQQGHRAKDCPERNKISKLCLKCGDLGHEMFSCRNDYCPDDLKVPFFGDTLLHFLFVCLYRFDDA